MLRSGMPTLGRTATLTPWIEFSCNRCPRRGRYRSTTLLARFGPDTEMHAVIDALKADCPRYGERRWTELCQACCPTLSEISRRVNGAP